MEKRKLVSVYDAGPIAELNFVNGPIGPTMISTSNIIKMVQNNRTVFEHDPNHRMNPIKLTMENIKKDNFNVVKSQDSVKNPEPVKAKQVIDETPSKEEDEKEVGSTAESAEEVSSKEEVKEKPVSASEEVEETVPAEDEKKEEETTVVETESKSEVETTDEKVDVEEEKKEETSSVSQNNQYQNKNQNKKNKGKNNRK